MSGDDIADEGIKYLMQLNGAKGQTSAAAMLAAEWPLAARARSAADEGDEDACDAK